jgi:hypothetical protein
MVSPGGVYVLGDQKSTVSSLILTLMESAAAHDDSQSYADDDDDDDASGVCEEGERGGDEGAWVGQHCVIDWPWRRLGLCVGVLTSSGAHSGEVPPLGNPDLAAAACRAALASAARRARRQKGVDLSAVCGAAAEAAVAYVRPVLERAAEAGICGYGETALPYPCALLQRAAAAAAAPEAAPPPSSVLCVADPTERSTFGSLATPTPGMPPPDGGGAGIDGGRTTTISLVISCERRRPTHSRSSPTLVPIITELQQQRWLRTEELLGALATTAAATAVDGAGAAADTAAGTAADTAGGGVSRAVLDWLTQAVHIKWRKEVLDVGLHLRFQARGLLRVGYLRRAGYAPAGALEVIGRFHILCGRPDWDLPTCCVFLS